MSLYDLVKPLLFSLDAETVHERVLHLLASGAIGSRSFSDRRLKTTAFGLDFAHPIGLAAGFDKNGIGVHSWDKVGFSFAEIGTVTAIPQAGNQKPRLFRLPKDQALINRMGFNNDGAEKVADRLAKSFAKRGKPTIPIGINLGKSKVTPLEKAAEDYVSSFRKLRPYGDYFVVNVSSPNTPGLRKLQEGDSLRRILGQLRDVDTVMPMLVKIAPDLPENSLEAEIFLDTIVLVAQEAGLNGIIATNTSISRPSLVTEFEEGCPSGGLSGKPIAAQSTYVLRSLSQRAGDSLTLIGVGGIADVSDLRRKLAAGATLVQVYTGWVYGGPDFVPDLLEALAG